MTTFLKFVGVAVAGIVIGAFISVGLNHGSFGGIYNQVQQNFDQGGLHVGPNGTIVSQLQKGTCTLIGTDTSQAASSTVPYDCAITGVVSGDVVFASLATTTAVGGRAYWEIVAAKASTTAGYITIMLYNNGAASVPSASSVGSSTPYLIVR